MTPSRHTCSPTNLPRPCLMRMALIQHRIQGQRRCILAESQLLTTRLSFHILTLRTPERISKHFRHAIRARKLRGLFLSCPHPRRVLPWIQRDAGERTNASNKIQLRTPLPIVRYPSQFLKFLNDHFDGQSSLFVRFSFDRLLDGLSGLDMTSRHTPHAGKGF